MKDRNGYINTFTIGSGMTVQELNAWFNECKDQLLHDATSPTIHNIVCGDDYFGLTFKDGNLIAIENDFSSFDRTQGVHALEAEYNILNAILTGNRDTDHLVVQILRENSRTTPVYVDRKTGERKKMNAPVQRFSGAPDTTLGNCLCNIMSIMYVNYYSKGFPDFTLQSKLGFVNKCVVLPLDQGPTFLKGWWVPTDNQVDWAWVPLPSQVVKLGKVGTPPEYVFKHVDRMQAHRMMAKGMSTSLNSVPRDYPILGKFLERYDNLTVEEVKPLVINKYKIDTTKKTCVQLDLDFVFRLFFVRYQLGFTEIVELEKQIASAPFPGLMLHPGWVVLGRRDYG